MTGIQDTNPEARPMDGDALYDVRVTIPELGGATPLEAAEVFWRVLIEEYHHGSLGTIYFEVKESGFEITHHVALNPTTGEAFYE